jgi:MYXO-CTERM domain-containing protein
MTLLLSLATAHAATLTVGPAATYTTIGAAVRASASGDTIRVQAGTYAEDLDLRGRNLTITSADGPAVTTLSPTLSIRLDAGTLEGFTISPAPSTAVAVASGSPTLRELYILAPSGAGVAVSGGSPTVEEVGVWDSGLSSFIVTGGTPRFVRALSYSPVTYGFQVKAASTLDNCVSIGGAYGFVFENAASTATNLVAVGASTSATAALGPAATLTNSAFEDNTLLLRCFSGNTLTFPNGVAYNTADASGCTGTPLASVRVSDPAFTSWGGTLPFEQIDLHPGRGSAMINGGSGLDADGTVADLGAFGGAEGDWTDGDGDDSPVLFDCDDHDANTAPGATEREDDRDNDCDGVVDEDIPVDTGGGDTDVVDTGGDTDVVDTGGDTDVVDTDTDTDVPADGDLDGDGFPASADCDEHNVATYPGAPERTDRVDNDCDGRADEGTASGDDDGDGYAELDGDCDDTRTDRYPAADDVDQADGVDNDCDGLADDATGLDRDGDGHLDSVDDCDDTDAFSNVDRSDPTDGVDDDCDGLADDDELRSDRDGDGFTPEQGDCDDGDAGVNAALPEINDDFIDQDCNGTDNYDADRDGDAAPASGGTDCDDTRSTVYPGAPELCGDTADNTCDGTVDEGCEDDGPADDGDGCGCAASGTNPSAAVLGAVAVLFAGRRRRLRVR